VTEDTLYLHPDSAVLRNKLGITDKERLEQIERLFVVERAAEGIPKGRFDLAHLRAIHRHLFQDIYEWAGELRKVEIAKDGHQFQFRQYLETGMADVARRLEKAKFLTDLSRAEFAAKAGEIMGDVNYVHPFREGNGRTQLYFLEQLAEQAGHPIDLGRFDPQRWIAASRAAHKGDYTLMAAEIARSVGPE
jgi:cell filamentation protein